MGLVGENWRGPEPCPTPAKAADARRGSNLGPISGLSITRLDRIHKPDLLHLHPIRMTIIIMANRILLSALLT